MTICQLTEYTTSRGTTLRVDSAAGVIHGVKVLGLSSGNGRSYLKEAVSRAAHLYEGARVNVNHPVPGTSRARDYRDRLGVLRGVRVIDDGLAADLHFNPKHPLAEQLLWDAEHAPENVGLSHNVQGRTTRRGEQTIVEEIISVHSVDLVTEPATTKSLFEGDGFQNPSAPPLDTLVVNPPAGEGDMTWDAYVQKAQHILRGEGDPPAKAKALAALTRTLVKLKGDVADGAESSTPATEGMAENLQRLREEIDRYKAAEALSQKQAAVGLLLARADLPAEIVTDLFREQLMATDEAGRKRLIEDRMALAKATRYAGPTSREQRLTEASAAPVTDTNSFVAALTA